MSMKIMPDKMILLSASIWQPWLKLKDIFQKLKGIKDLIHLHKKMVARAEGAYKVRKN